MLVQLVDGLQVVSYSICPFPSIVCGTGARDLSDIVECHVVSSLSHDIVLGFDWLCICNPHINWQACTLFVQVPGGPRLLAGLPCDSIAHVELVSLDSVCKEVDFDAIAWFTLIHPVEFPDAMGACGTLASGSLEMPRLTIGMLCVWSLLMFLNFCLT